MTWYNESLKFFEVVAGWVHGQPRAPVGAQIRVVVVHEEGNEGWSFAAGRVLFLADAREGLGSAKYPEIACLEEWVEPAGAALERLRQLLTGEAVIDGERVVAKLKGGSTGDRLEMSGRSNISGWPEQQGEVHSEFDKNRRLELPSRPIVVLGRPAYLGGAHFMNARLFEKPGSRSTGEVGRLQVIVPELRARFSSAEWTGGRFTAKLDFAEPRQRDDVEVHLMMSGAASSEGLFGQPNADGLVSFMATPTKGRENDAAQALLVHRGLGVLDEAWAKHIAAEEERPPSPDALERVRQELLGGENEQVEYKPFARDRAKQIEIIESLVAFLNTHGGRIYIGVKDKNGEPFGQGELRKAVEANSTKEAIEKTKDRLREMLKAEIHPMPQQHEVRHFEIEGEPVIVVEVPEGSNPPYSVAQTNDILVRRGGNDYKATNAEVRALDAKKERAELAGAAAWPFLNGGRLF